MSSAINSTDLSLIGLVEVTGVLLPDELVIDLLVLEVSVVGLLTGGVVVLVGAVLLTRVEEAVGEVVFLTLVEVLEGIIDLLAEGVG